MREDYLIIKTEYDSFYNKMLLEGRLPLKETELGYWGISTADDIFQLFETIRLERFRNFVDLGSGDGKVAMIASLFTKATGIECDKELVNHSKRIKKKLGLSAKIIHGDYLEQDLTSYDLIFINPDQQMTRLEPKLHRELRGKFVVYGPHYHPTLLKKEAGFIAHTSQVTVYGRQS